MKFENDSQQLWRRVGDLPAVANRGRDRARCFLCAPRA